jgi:hypothetical protein
MDFPVIDYGRRADNTSAAPAWPLRPPSSNHADEEEACMSKGMDQKKSEKKAPTKTLKEKRAEKQEKKKNK